MLDNFLNDPYYLCKKLTNNLSWTECVDDDPTLWWTHTLTHKSTHLFCFMLKQKLKTKMLHHFACACPSSNTMWKDEWPLSISVGFSRSPGETTPLPSSAPRSARQRIQQGSLVDLWTSSTSLCRRTPGAGSAAPRTTLRTCRGPSWSDRWLKSAWWDWEERDEWRQEVGEGG